LSPHEIQVFSGQIKGTGGILGYEKIIIIPLLFVRIIKECVAVFPHGSGIISHTASPLNSRKFSRQRMRIIIQVNFYVQVLEHLGKDGGIGFLNRPRRMGKNSVKTNLFLRPEGGRKSE
jgi:hypothetical protein